MGNRRNAQRNTRLKIALSFSAALALALLIGTGGFGAPRQAQAAPPTISGTCTVTCLNPDDYGTRGIFRVEFPAYGITATGYCISGQEYGTPAPGDYPYTGVRQDNGTYRIVVDCSGGACYPQRPSPLGPQNVGDFEITLPGAVGVQKVPTATAADAVTGNPLYSLAGAVYGVYADEACRTELQTIETDANGYAESAPTLQPGTYWLRELRAPTRYALDGTAHRVELGMEDCPGGVAVAQVAETPQLAPVNLVVAKVDAETGTAAPQGDATLAGAVFAIDHYAGRFATAAEAEASGAARTSFGTATTDERGEARIDPAALPGNGQLHGFPLGTVVVREVTPPAGYLLADEPAVAVPVEAAGDAPAVAAFRAPRVADRVIRGDVALVKYGDRTPTGPGSQPLAGVAFDLVHAATGELAARIITDENGFATTAGLGPDGHGALPYGTYLVHEDPATTPAGYRPVDPFPVTIAEDGATLTYPVENGTGTFVHVEKRDAGTGNPAHGIMRFRVLDEAGNPVRFGGPEPREGSETPEKATGEANGSDGASSAPLGSPTSEFATDENGTCVLPGKLNGAGTYYLQEIEAPRGYALAKEPVAFEVGSGSANDPIVVVIEDEPQTVELTVRKTDAATGAAIEQAGITWDVRATADIVTADGTVRAVARETVARLESDATGCATSAPLYPGVYDVVETREPDGYERALEPLRVELAPGDPTEVTSQATLDFPNERITIPATLIGPGDVAETPAPADAPTPAAPGTPAQTGDAPLPFALLALVGAAAAALTVARLARR